MGIDLVTWGLDQLGVTVNPFVAYILLGVGGFGILAGCVGGIRAIWHKLVKRRPTCELREVSVPPPLELAFEVKQFRCLDANDEILGRGGQAGDVEVLADILFTPKHPPVKPFQVMLEIHSKRIPARILMGDIYQQVSHSYFFIVEQALAKATDGRIVVTTDQGKACSPFQRITFIPMCTS